MFQLRAAVIAALFCLATGLPASAQDVTLTSRDGAIEVAGTLLGYDGEFYRVDTVYGALTFDGSAVICAGPGCPDPEAYIAEVRIAGARSIGRTLLPVLLERFAAERQMSVRRVVSGDDRFRYDMTSDSTGQIVARFSFDLARTADGFSALVDDRADMVLATREATRAEIRAAEANDVGDLSASRRSKIVALDALVPVVGRGNTLSTITPETLSAVLDGRITNWAELGGPDEAIILHGLSAEADIGADRWTTGTAREIHDDIAALVDAVAPDPFAIGLTRYSEIGNARPLALAGPCGFDLRASPLSLKTEDYPLTTPLFLYTPARRLPKTAREFLHYLGTPDAQRFVRRAGFVGQNVVPISVGAQGERLANAIARAGEEVGLADLQRMTSALVGRSRLSLSFRFRAGSTTLDAQSQANVRQLAELLESGQFDGRELLFAGFSDGDGPAAANQSIALKRAEAVMAAVHDAAPMMDGDRVTLAADGFGEAMPMACDDSEWGRQVNRRVELWIGPGQR